MPKGSRIKFLEEIIEPATGDHPEFLLAKKGGTGHIVGKRPAILRFDYNVLWDEYTVPFCADRKEFEIIKGEK